LEYLKHQRSMRTALAIAQDKTAQYFSEQSNCVPLHTDMVAPAQQSVTHWFEVQSQLEPELKLERQGPLRLTTVPADNTTRNTSLAFIGASLLRRGAVIVALPM
jgi:hypothetical protein